MDPIICYFFVVAVNYFDFISAETPLWVHDEKEGPNFDTEKALGSLQSLSFPAIQLPWPNRLSIQCHDEARSYTAR